MLAKRQQSEVEAERWSGQTAIGRQSHTIVTEENQGAAKDTSMLGRESPGSIQEPEMIEAMNDEDVGQQQSDSTQTGYNFEEYEPEFTQNVDDPKIFLLKHLTDQEKNLNIRMYIDEQSESIDWETIKTDEEGKQIEE